MSRRRRGTRIIALAVVIALIGVGIEQLVVIVADDIGLVVIGDVVEQLCYSKS